MDSKDEDMTEPLQQSPKPGVKRVAIRSPEVSPLKEHSEQADTMDMDKEEEENNLLPNALDTQFQRVSGEGHTTTGEIVEKIRTDNWSTKDWDNPQFF